MDKYIFQNLIGQEIESITFDAPSPWLTIYAGTNGKIQMAVNLETRFYVVYDDYGATKLRSGHLK